VFPGRSATSGRNDRRQDKRSFEGGNDGSPSCSTEKTEGES
jgi:hypothetical protein